MQKEGHTMQNTPPKDPQDQTIFNPIPSLSGAQPPLQGGNQAQPGKQQPLFYTLEEDDPDLQLPLLDEPDDQADQSSPFVLPFQNSAAMPTLATMNAQSQRPAESPPPAALPATKKRWGAFQLLKMLLIASVVLITVIVASLFVFVQSTTSPHTTPGSSIHTPGTIGKPTQGPPAPPPRTKPSSLQKVATPSHQEQETPGSATSPSETLPSIPLLNQIGWTQVGLTIGDALEALRTGSTFTDREMSYDYRSIGTPTNHSGTLTGATFLLTPGGKNRFLWNDVRMINNVLYDKIQTDKIIQQVVPQVQPSLVQFQIVQVQGQRHKFAWVNVPFELLQSMIDPASGNRTEGLERDSATGQPLLHHMAVLLIRVPPQNQGANAPMGGTGWLVDTYALDTNTLPTLATDPSL